MPIKYNVNHKVRFGRGRSHYPERLRKRGLAKAPALADAGGLRARQERRITETCSLTHVHDVISCDGKPWLFLAADVSEADLTETDAEPDQPEARLNRKPALADQIKKLAEHYTTAV